MTQIPCRKIRFYSSGDEQTFFSFARSIPAVRKIEGVSDSIILHIRIPASDASLRDLIALLFRYKVDMEPLAQFKTNKNSEWFLDSSSFWFKKVFKK